jgi:hypothetical protein
MKSTSDQTFDSSWKTLYLAGSISALLFVIMVIIPITFIFTLPLPPAKGGSAVLIYIAQHKAIYLTELICFVGLSAPALIVFASIAMYFKEINKTISLIGGLIGISSEIIALALGASPQSLNGGLIYLSDQYALASEIQRANLSTAAESLIASTNAVTSAGILTALSILIISIAATMKPGEKYIAYLGIITGISGIISESLRPIIGAAYGFYGILLPIWFIIVGIRLFKASRLVKPIENE